MDDLGEILMQDIVRDIRPLWLFTIVDHVDIRSFKGPQIRLLLNSATYPLHMCQKSFKDKKYGTCSLEEFVKANSYSTNVHFHDKTWNASCEAEAEHVALTNHFVTDGWYMD